MNKELYKENKKQLKELGDLRFIVNSLKKFLDEHELKFKNQESIEALKKIKLYLEVKQKEYENSQHKQEQLYKSLCNTCKHEIAIKYNSIPSHICLVCQCSFDKNGIPIHDIATICIDATKDYEAACIIGAIFEEVLNNDKDLIETINDAVEELQYDRNIKVYRRTK